MSALPKLCPVCNREVARRRSDAVYCSVQCNQTAEKRRLRTRRTGIPVKPRGKNTGRSLTKEYKAEHQRKIKERQRGGKPSRHAQALSLGYRSMFEVSIAKAVEEAGLVMDYEPYFIPYVMKGSYKPDFQLPNGIIVEAKGYLDAGSCKKMKAVKASNPNLDIRFVFQHANGKRNKRAKLRNWEWAERHGFPWAEGTIPLSWFKEKRTVNA